MIEYKKGDLLQDLQPEGKVFQFVPHCCNNVGGFGSGFAGALNKHFGVEMGSPRSHYLHSPKKLGTVSYFNTGQVFVANMIGQNDCGYDGRKYVRYWALAQAMLDVQAQILWKFQSNLECEILCPKFGCGLAGGKWEVVEELIKEIWSDEGIRVVVYEL